MSLLAPFRASRDSRRLRAPAVQRRGVVSSTATPSGAPGTDTDASTVIDGTSISVSIPRCGWVTQARRPSRLSAMTLGPAPTTTAPLRALVRTSNATRVESPPFTVRAVRPLGVKITRPGDRPLCRRRDDGLCSWKMVRESSRRLTDQISVPSDSLRHRSPPPAPSASATRRLVARAASRRPPRGER